MIRYPAICLIQGQDYIFVYPAEITHIMAEDSHVKVYMHNQDPVSVSKNLKELETVLPSEVFLRVHHSAIINLMYVDKFHQNDNSTIELTGGEIIPLSRRRKSTFLEKFTKL